jgi:hypothetical protein
VNGVIVVDEEDHLLLVGAKHSETGTSDKQRVTIEIQNIIVMVVVCTLLAFVDCILIHLDRINSSCGPIGHGGERCQAHEKFRFQTLKSNFKFFTIDSVRFSFTNAKTTRASHIMVYGMVSIQHSQLNTSADDERTSSTAIIS